MADRRPAAPVPPARPAPGGDDGRKGGGGWQKPVAPPSQDSRPSGLPEKKSS